MSTPLRFEKYFEIRNERRAIGVLLSDNDKHTKQIQFPFFFPNNNYYNYRGHVDTRVLKSCQSIKLHLLLFPLAEIKILFLLEQKKQPI